MRLQPSRLLLKAFGQPRQASLRQAHVSFLQPLLRTINPRSALRAKQGILHVNSHYNLQSSCPANRRNNGIQRRQPRPSNNPFPISPPEPPTKRSSHPKTAIISCAPPKPNQKRRHNLPLKNLRNKDSQTIRIQVKRMKLVRRQLRQPRNPRRLNNRRARSRNPPPRRPNGLPGGVDCFETPPPPFFLQSNGFPKTIPAVTHWNQLQKIPRPNAAPTPRNRSGRFHRSQRPLELIGNNNDSRKHKQTLPKAKQSFQPRHFAATQITNPFYPPALLSRPTVRNCKNNRSNPSPRQNHNPKPCQFLFPLAAQPPTNQKSHFPNLFPPFATFHHLDEQISNPEFPNPPPKPLNSPSTPLPTA